MPVAYFILVLVPLNLVGLASTTTRFVLDDPSLWILSLVYFLGAALSNLLVLALQRRIRQARGRGPETWREAFDRAFTKPYGILTPDFQRTVEDRPEHAPPVLGASARSMPTMCGIAPELFLVGMVMGTLCNVNYWSMESYFRLVPWI